MKRNDTIEFLRQKNYVYLEEIGQGGTGKTILVKDEIIDEVFVCKKYFPCYKNDQGLYFKYFIEEIKLLHKIYHKNIVRVFNYYLYTEQVTGYILMEFIKGQRITDFLMGNPDKLDELFVQIIEGFWYLEENNILHRDIRPENILVTENGIVKIIDFGFGKTINFDNNQNSISLNWRYEKPNEFQNNVYDFKSEIYFVGKLFEEILLSIENVNFKFLKLISKMIAGYETRISSFFDIYREVIGQLQNNVDFAYYEIATYREFANDFDRIVASVPYEIKYEKNIDQIIKQLEELYKNSMLEDVIQNNNKLTSIFFEGKYTFYPKIPFKVSTLLSMLKLLKSCSQDKQKIILNNLWERFDKIQRLSDLVATEPIDDLPF